MPDEDTAQATTEAQPPDQSKSRSSKFRFKSKHDADHRSDSQRSHKRRRDERSPDRERRRRRRHRHHHRSRSSRSPRQRDAQSQTDQYNTEPLDPDAAFRESLFDALADDEGAAYWEGVYGQPIHIYPNVKPGYNNNTDYEQGHAAAAGELEQMDDEEYAAYVRSRMWEKTHEHVVEERKRREEQRQRRQRERAEEEKEEAGSRQRNGHAFEEMIDAALRRGERRKRQKGWEQAWQEYVDKWTRLTERSKQHHGEGSQMEQNGSAAAAVSEGSPIPWPVNSGKREDVSRDAVRDFFLKHDRDELPRLLKVERVQWHPDKMQQRLVGQKQKMDDETLKSVTAVFQIVDDLWAEVKST